MVNILGRKVFAEFLGTFILAASIQFMTVYDQDDQTNLVITILAGFFIAITLTREISGGHINPAVTFTVYLAEQREKEKNDQANIMWTYIVSQVGGAITAVFLGQLLYNENSFKLNPAPGAYASEAFIAEVLGSALFYTVILVQGDKDAKLTNDKSLSTLMITAGLAGGVAISGNISGGCVNPALGFAFNFARLLSTGKLDECRFLWLYIIGPLTGSIVASYFYTNIFKRYFEQEGEEKKEYKLLDSD